ncbi:MAG: TolC family protein [Nibricoccus sp.]
MTFFSRLATLSLVFASFLPVIHAQTAAADNPAPLTLEECVARALEKNFDVSLQRLTTDSAANDVQIAKAIYDPTLSLETSRSFNKTAPDTTIITTTDPVTGAVTTTSQNSLSTKSTSDDTRASVAQRVVTGATVTATGVLDRNYRKPVVSSGLNPAYTGNVGLVVRQPLLKGAGTGVNRAAIERAKLGLGRSNYDLKSTVLTVVRSVESAYYNLVFAREQREVRRFSLEVAQKLLEENRARRATGVATDLEVLQSEVGVANAQRDLVLANQTVRNSEDALMQLIGRFEFDQPPGQVRFSEEAAPVVSFDRSFKLARDNQPDILSSTLAIEQFKLDVKTTKNARLPQVDLTGQVGQASKENSYSRASTNVWDGKGYNWQLDLSVTMPWGLRAESARYRNAQIALTREQTRLQFIEQNILVQVRTAIRAVETSLENVRITALALELSQKQFEQEKARYEAGLSTFRFVQQSQAELDAARVNALQAKVNLRFAYADLAKLEGSSLPRYNINLAGQ